MIICLYRHICILLYYIIIQEQWTALHLAALNANSDTVDIATSEERSRYVYEKWGEQWSINIVNVMLFVYDTQR